jgi:2-oxoglutarate ferredoxin oxidoreductase subunit delta
MQVRINAALCKGCGFCVKFCPERALAMSEQRGPKGDFLPDAAPERCTGCITCAQMCPEGAITIKEVAA